MPMTIEFYYLSGLEYFCIKQICNMSPSTTSLTTFDDKKKYKELQGNTIFHLEQTAFSDDELGILKIKFK